MMPIKGITDSSFERARIGIIKLGVRVQGQEESKGYPKAVDHFVCPEAVTLIYGAVPVELDVMMVSDLIEECVDADLILRDNKSGRILCKGDGETATVRKQDTDETKVVPCHYYRCRHFASKHCKREGWFRFLLPRVPGIGFWVIYTSSKASISHIKAQLEQIKQVEGRITGIPLILQLVKGRIRNPEGHLIPANILSLSTPGALSDSLRFYRRRELEREEDTLRPADKCWQCFAQLTPGQIRISQERFGVNACASCISSLEEE